jgi:hypothetical protein
LIALCDPNHIDHQRVTLWFEEIGGQAGGSCLVLALEVVSEIDKNANIL